MIQRTISIKNYRSKLFLLFSLVCLSLFGQIKESSLYKDNWNSLKQHEASPDWLKDVKFGVFFHWGLCAVPAEGGKSYGRFMYVPDRNPKKWGGKINKQHKKTYGENFHYHDFIPKWKANKFNAKQWLDLFEDSGFKLIGSMAEHHDGFSLWNSKVNPWNSAKMGPKTDFVKALSQETRKRNLKFMTTFHHGMHLLFYPKKDNTWLRPVSVHQYVYKDCKVPQDKKYAKLYGNMSWDAINDLWLEKLNEVVDQYIPDYIWMDYGHAYVKESHRKQFLANYFNKAKEANKQVAINTKGDIFPEDLAIISIERATMPNIKKEVWVADFPLGVFWCYDKTKRRTQKPEFIIRTLADITSKNGLMLLSAGPKSDGTFPEEQVLSLKKVGSWLKQYGEAIYNTRPFVVYGEGITKLLPNNSGDSKRYGALVKGLKNLNAHDIRYTQKGKTIYAIQLGWEVTTKPKILSVFAKDAKQFIVKKVSVLGSTENISWKKTNKGLIINNPKVKPLNAELALVYKIEIK